VVRLAGRQVRVAFVREAPDRLFAELEGDGERRRLDVGLVREGALLLDGRPLEYRVVREARSRFTLEAQGESWPVEVLSDAEAALQERGAPEGRGGGAVTVRAPMPGRVLALLVSEGQTVPAGHGLLIVEAMKMENEIRAPHSGRVRHLRVAEGDAVEADQPLCDIDEEAEDGRETSGAATMESAG
jgi:biotin carboxyl carrier protein